MLNKRNDLHQDHILELAHFLNFTMVQVSEHQNVLYQFDTKFFSTNKILLECSQLPVFLCGHINRYMH